jgi:hypothetical protein
MVVLGGRSRIGQMPYMRLRRGITLAVRVEVVHRV